jgi:hypothetical protein
MVLYGTKSSKIKVIVIVTLNLNTVYELTGISNLVRYLKTRVWKMHELWPARDQVVLSNVIIFKPPLNSVLQMYCQLDKQTFNLP